MGLRQRLSLAVAVLHEPKMLILDEPTSGVDPVARDSFWELLIDLSRKQGVTIFVTTHFMNEGMRCDRISLMHAGKVLACDAPAEADRRARRRRAWRTPSSATWRTRSPPARPTKPPATTRPPPWPLRRRARRRPSRRSGPRLPAALGRMLAYARNETMQILRDPVRLAFAFVGSALLMLVFGFGITTDVEHIRYATLDLRSVAREPRVPRAVRAVATPYFTPTPPARSADDALERLQSDDVSLVLEIPPNFGRDFRRGAAPEVLAQVDGAMTVPRRDRRAVRAGRARHRCCRTRRPGCATAPPKYTRRHPGALHVQPDVREHLLDRAERPGAAACS